MQFLKSAVKDFTPDKLKLSYAEIVSLAGHEFRHFEQDFEDFSGSQKKHEKDKYLKHDERRLEKDANETQKKVFDEIFTPVLERLQPKKK